MVARRWRALAEQDDHGLSVEPTAGLHPGLRQGASIPRPRRDQHRRVCELWPEDLARQDRLEGAAERDEPVPVTRSNSHVGAALGPDFSHAARTRAPVLSYEHLLVLIAIGGTRFPAQIS